MLNNLKLFNMKTIKEFKTEVAKEMQNVFDDKTITNVERLKRIETIVVRCTAEQKKIYTDLAKVKKMPLSRLIRNSMNLTIKTNTLQPKKTAEELKADYLKFQKFVQSL